MKWTLSKGVIAGIATDAYELPALLDDAHAPRLPWCSELSRTVCVRAVAFVATTERITLAEAHTEREALKSNMSRFSAPEAYEIATVHVHERRDVLRGHAYVRVLAAFGKQTIHI
jgi:hypothetical protein